ncbi:hypothetical protein BJAS_P1140 [Bathymodiolus japonicus methanotrophic gill symbiont]|uniref:hypothetical protein n=1 Tax=Bathymodiolus japonicus methanotrophic gill symbiont TaxID=113269 RepID=UPI001B4AE65F|nr:hypothetical protein [Bathymodiolus japonicus methanotrophic gill symbiont]GFO71539.1 hypothetical protein BJAS_P1140 [Bathymodiolus japonicus methanotrophic gill symbiont]
MIKKSLKIACLFVSIGFAGSAFAYNAGNTERKCQDPKFKTFVPAHKSEVDPESEISFTVSGYADPTTIKATAKNVPLELTIVDKNSFYAVSAKLHASLTGKYARIHVRAHNSVECKSKDGWLIKIRDKPASAEAVETGAIVEESEQVQ